MNTSAPKNLPCVTVGAGVLGVGDGLLSAVEKTTKSNSINMSHVTLISTQLKCRNRWFIKWGKQNKTKQKNKNKEQKAKTK